MFFWKYEKFVEYFEKVFVISKESGEREKEGEIYSNFGGVFFVFSLYDKFIEYFKNGFVISEEIGNKLLEGKFYNKFGKVYFFKC